MFCTAFALTLGLSASSQCPNDPWEVGYQAIHTVDYAQTITVARSPECVEEDDNLTDRIIGHHPTSAKVAAWWAAESMIHYAVSGWLDRTVEATDSNNWRAARWVWRIYNLGVEVQAVSHNYNQGITPFGGSLCHNYQHHASIK